MTWEQKLDWQPLPKSDEWVADFEYFKGNIINLLVYITVIDFDTQVSACFDSSFGKCMTESDIQVATFF